MGAQETTLVVGLEEIFAQAGLAGAQRRPPVRWLAREAPTVARTKVDVEATSSSRRHLLVQVDLTGSQIWFSGYNGWTFVLAGGTPAGTLDVLDLGGPVEGVAVIKAETLAIVTDRQYPGTLISLAGTGSPVTAAVFIEGELEDEHRVWNPP